ncbi:2-dehydro-3-deoxygluconokinase [Hephaestia caeni]|uniref:2-dehydro-3-deoxygluconokinase n=1 Tax=Hephaestia caeni TaxID=645617 RepID=A0A397PD77_9SPHN|nr:sugar kinase [Hephaestia caeni]RIA46928.1 2-dehydro-3-deoxygluconokinase [Hephaestia caeni]
MIVPGAQRPAARLAFLGELLVRLSPPGRQLLKQTRALDLHVGGAEANVAIGLARLSHDARMIGRVPDSALGDLAIGVLRGAGVDCRHVTRATGRMGLYFLTPGAGLRASEIVYDRGDSVFALADADDIDWDGALDGVTHLHLSGITPALGARSAALALAGVRAAKERDIVVSFDGNYRAQLWSAWDSDPRTILRELVGMADILFGNHRDVALLLDRDFKGDGPDRRREAAEAAFTAFPNLLAIASTARHIVDTDCHRLAARIDTAAQQFQTPEVVLSNIVDRIGAGDAFAAGVLHGLLTSDGDIKVAAQTGLALAALKHSLPGDASYFDQNDIDAFLRGGLDVRR